MSTTTVTETIAITVENVATLFPDVDTSLARSILPSSSDPSVRQGGDLEGYDEEQVKLMEEVCIVLDNDDKPIGSASKKTCTLPLFLPSFLRLIEMRLLIFHLYRPFDDKHQPRTFAPCVLRLPVRLSEPPAAATTSC